MEAAWSEKGQPCKKYGSLVSVSSPSEHLVSTCHGVGVEAVGSCAGSLQAPYLGDLGAKGGGRGVGDPGPGCCPGQKSPGDDTQTRNYMAESGLWQLAEQRPQGRGWSPPIFNFPSRVIVLGQYWW